MSFVMPSVVRLGDLCTGHGSFPGRPCIEASGDVFVNGLPAHRVTDGWAVHTDGTESHPGTTIEGIDSVLINGKPIAVVGGGAVLWRQSR